MEGFYEEGRLRELTGLEEQYESSKFEFAVIYGRRRVGKTSIISEFIGRGDKKAIRYIATESADAVNREDFSKKVFSVYPEYSSLKIFPAWETAFDYIAKQAKGERLILVIDEYPYIAKEYPPISSELQRIIDTVLKDTKIMLVLCGSSMSFMEKQVLAYQSPLYGRRTSQYLIKALDYYSSAEFFGNAGYEDKLLAYAVTGGIPLYLSLISDAETVAEGIDRQFFSAKGFLYEEPKNLLKQELREPALYNGIITAIAGGATKLNEIAGRVKELDSTVAKDIKNLIELDIVKKKASMFADTERAGRYSIKDGMYRFWHRFIPRSLDLIADGRKNIFRDTDPSMISDFMGHAFEDICEQYLRRMNVRDRLPFLFNKIGKWWGGDPRTKEETEIDIIAVNDNKAILGECKWTNKKAGTEVYQRIKEKTAAVPQLIDRDVYYYLFSRSGFTETLRREAEGDGKLKLVNLNDLFDPSISVHSII
ncbi:MAG: ATP-binding protein [Methanomassiliicoccaceae archaeon]|nr:ATP-binding protein [Methanomassiliicoccaceae archaeon]